MRMGEKVRVLHIDDSEGVLELSKEILESKNRSLSVDTVQDAENLSSTIQSSSYNCVVVDHDGRNMDAFQLIEDIEALIGSVPVVLFTEEDSSDFISKVTSSDLTDYVQKRPGLKSYDLLYKRVMNYIELDKCRGNLDRTQSVHNDVIEDLRNIYRVTSSKSLGFHEKNQKLLEIGVENIGLSTGFLSQVSDEEMIIKNAVSKDDKIEIGDRIPLQNTYCRETFESDDDLLVIQDGRNHGDEEGDSRPYEVFGLSKYIGAKVRVNGEVYGTLCFTSEGKDGVDIDETQKAVVEVIARWISYELEKIEYTNEIEESNKKLRRFADILSHDLKNPLTIATSYLQLERENNQSENLETIDRSLDRIESIIESCLTISRDKVPTSDDTINLDEAVDRALFTVGCEDINVESHFDDALTIRADEDQFQVLLENLLKNASVHGAEPIEVRFDDGRMTISDNGDGFDDDTDSLFDFSVNDGEGRGIGLYIVDQVCQNNDWVISAYNSNNGAVFEIKGFDDFGVIK